jgi:hypothetical protein
VHWTGECAARIDAIKGTLRDSEFLVAYIHADISELGGLIRCLTYFLIRLTGATRQVAPQCFFQRESGLATEPRTVGMFGARVVYRPMLTFDIVAGEASVPPLLLADDYAWGVFRSPRYGSSVLQELITKPNFCNAVWLEEEIKRI